MKNLKKISREVLKTFNGGDIGESCPVGKVLCYSSCLIFCMKGSDCKPSFCNE